MEWHYSHSPPTKKVQVTALSRQSDVYRLWDAQDIILLDFLEPEATVNSERYIKTLIKLKATLELKARTRSEKKTFFLQHDYARQHASSRPQNVWLSLAGQCCFIRHTALTLHHQIFICLGLYKKVCGDSILLTAMLS